MDLPFVPNRDAHPQKRVFAFIRCERDVFADLSQVYFRIMRELGMRNGVPFHELRDQQGLPDELQGIAAKLTAYALGDRASHGLDPDEETLLRTRYIHLSSHWNPMGYLVRDSAEVVFIHRPNENGQRSVFPNE
ncbi:hypothetical protein D9M71_679140 [compost metagenome]